MRCSWCSGARRRGKDGTVRKVFGACNPLGCQVTSFKVPTPEELSHDYLWRVTSACPHAAW
jgi:polyphosphate kinase 2 (PPK2 family)